MTEADHDDLSIVIEKVLPHAPHFKTLLESQLHNCKSKDARHRRWDVNMISLCLNLWAKYVDFLTSIIVIFNYNHHIQVRKTLFHLLYLRSPNAYHDLRDSGFLILPSERVLRYHKNKIRHEPGTGIFESYSHRHEVIFINK